MRSVEIEGMFNREDFIKKLNGHPRLIQVTVESFLGSWQQDFHMVEMAVKRHSAQELKESAHRLKGSLSYFGDTAPLALTKSLEQLGKADKLDGAQALCADLREKLFGLNTTLNSLLLDYAC